MSVLWTSDLPAEGAVRWGPAGKAAAGELRVEPAEFRYPKAPEKRNVKPEDLPAEEVARAYVYEARISGLAPGTAYRYALEFAGRTTGGKFMTFPERPAPFTFIAFSDTHADDVVAARFARHRPALLINSGDLVDREHYTEYRRFFSPAITAVAGRFPMFVARGNHDQSGAMLARLFSLPADRLYYSFDYANAHFVCLDSCLWRWPDSEEKIRAMLEWCERDLQASRADWKIVFFHEPPYDLSYRRSDWGRSDAMPVFRRCGVDLIFCGHAHAYQRFGPLVWPGQNDQHPIMLVVSAGGSSKYVAKPARAEPHLAVRSGTDNYVVCRIEGEKLTARALTAKGVQIDAFAIAKKDGRLDGAYLAQAMPEESFGRVERALAEIWVPRDFIPAGEEFAIEVKLEAGSEAIEYDLRPSEKSLKAVEPVAPAKGTVPANDNAVVSVKLRARVDISKPEKGSRAEPAVVLECRYRAGGREGLVTSTAAMMKPGA
jgi:predicted phosphodiesterase